jgi:hypothetical protein
MPRALKCNRLFSEAFERRERVPEFVLDLGDQGLWLGTFRFYGNLSGVELEREWGQLAMLRGGPVAREQYFFGWDYGLRAAGLDPAAVALPRARGQPSGGQHHLGRARGGLVAARWVSIKAEAG